MQKPIKIILIVLAVIIGLFAALLIWLTATQLNVKTCLLYTSPSPRD